MLNGPDLSFEILKKLKNRTAGLPEEAGRSGSREREAYVQARKPGPSATHALLLKQLLARLVLAQATTLARSGRYAEAEKMLGDLPERLEMPAVLDLQARISAQQGRLSEAREYWERARQIDPTDGAYTAALLRIQLEQSSHQQPGASGTQDTTGDS